MVGGRVTCSVTLFLVADDCHFSPAAYVSDHTLLSLDHTGKPHFSRAKQNRRTRHTLVIFLLVLLFLVLHQQQHQQQQQKQKTKENKKTKNKNKNKTNKETTAIAARTRAGTMSAQDTSAHPYCKELCAAVGELAKPLHASNQNSPTSSKKNNKQEQEQQAPPDTTAATTGDPDAGYECSICLES